MDQDLTVRVHRVHRRWRSSPPRSEDDDGDGGVRRGSKTRRRRAETTPARLLHQFPASACSPEAERGGALRVQYLAGGAGDVKLEREGRGEGVWEVAGSGASWFVWSAGPFTGRRDEGEGVQWVAGAGCAGDVQGRHRPRWPCLRAGGLLSRPWSAMGRCWRGHGGRKLAEREKEKRGGVRAVSSISSHVARLGSGQRGLVSTAASSTSMATGTRRTGAVIYTVTTIFPIFVCQVFDEMPAWNLIWNFWNFSLWVISILAKVSKDIFVTKKG
jgi:hypothetical protein